MAGPLLSRLFSYFEVVDAPEGLDLGTPVLLSAHPEGEQVNVVAALGQEAEARLGLVAPVAPLLFIFSK